MSDADGVDRVLSAITGLPSLEVSADLTVSVEGVELTVTSFTDLVHIEVATVRDAVTLFRATEGRRPVGRIAAGLSAAGLTAEVYIGGTSVALLGADADPGPVGRRVGGVELRPVGVVLAALRAP